MDGKQHRESAKTEDEITARKFLRRRLRESAREDFVGSDQRKVRVNDLLDLVVLDYAVNRRRSKIEHKLPPVREAFGHLRAVDLTSTTIERVKLQWIEEGRANGTINRFLAALKRAYRIGLKRRIVSNMPAIDLLQEAPPRQGFVEPVIFEKIAAGLPEVIADVVRFLYASSWRKAEVTGLTWQDVNLPSKEIRLPQERSKNGHGRLLPLEGELLSLVRRRWESRAFDAEGRPLPWVFHRRGRPVRRFEDAWRTATKRAGIPGLLIHDLRRSGIRNLIRSGVSETTAMSISGHLTSDTFKRYDVTSDRDAREAIARSQVWVQSERGGEPAQNPHSSGNPTGGKISKSSG